MSLDDRRLFQYRFVRQKLQVAMPYEHILAFAQSPYLRKRHTATLRPPLRSWNTERWYVVLQGSKLLEFATEDQTSLPEEIANVIRDILQLPISEKQTFLARDLCLGYCYDPLAEMGYYSAFEEQAKLLRTQ
jgi:hypothetical protein